MDLGVNAFGAVGPQAGQRAFLATADETGVAHHVGAQDRCKPSFNPHCQILPVLPVAAGTGPPSRPRGLKNRSQCSVARTRNPAWRGMGMIFFVRPLKLGPS